MATHSKHDRRKKAAPAKTSASQAEALRENDEAPVERTPAARATSGRSRHASASRRDGTVRTSTLWLTAALCLLLGICLGTLLPAVLGPHVTSSIRQSPPPQASAPAGQSADNSGHLRELEEAARAKPQDLHAWIQLGNHYFDGNKPRDAIRAYERALAIKGDNPDVLTDMGIMHRQLGEFERAAEFFTQASRLNPLHEQSRFNLGVVLFFDLKREEEARKVWRALVGINPGAKTPDGALLRTMLDELQ